METLSTLRFAARAKKVRNYAKVNKTESFDAAAVTEGLKSQLDETHALLEAARARAEHMAIRCLQSVHRLPLSPLPPPWP